MAQARWVALIAALAAALAVFAVPLTPLQGFLPARGGDAALSVMIVAAAALQAVGARGMSLSLRGRGKHAPVSVILAYLGALCWVIALLAGLWATQSGPAGITIGLLLMAPAAIFGLALQIVALAALARVDRTASAH